MGTEIERKYLVKNKIWNKLDKKKGIYLRQGYLFVDDKKSIRVRVADSNGYLTIKTNMVGCTRNEFEYEIPVEEAKILLDSFVLVSITKTRYSIIFGGKKWETDVFHGDNDGLILSEIELTNEDEYFELPEWIGDEVTQDERYYNINLSVTPYKKWNV